MDWIGSLVTLFLSAWTKEQSGCRKIVSPLPYGYHLLVKVHQIVCVKISASTPSPPSAHVDSGISEASGLFDRLGSRGIHVSVTQDTHPQHIFEQCSLALWYDQESGRVPQRIQRHGQCAPIATALLLPCCPRRLLCESRICP